MELPLELPQEIMPCRLEAIWHLLTGVFKGFNIPVAILGALLVIYLLIPLTDILQHLQVSIQIEGVKLKVVKILF